MRKLNKETRLGFRLVWMIASLGTLFALSAFQVFTGEHTEVVIRRLTGMTEPNAYAVNAFVRKVAHVLVFGLLGLLFYAVLGKRPIRYAWLLTVLAAGLDEWHQSFVPGRSPSVWDVVLDSLAALLFLGGAAFWKKR